MMHYDKPTFSYSSIFPIQWQILNIGEDLFISLYKMGNVFFQ